MLEAKWRKRIRPSACCVIFSGTSMDALVIFYIAFLISTLLVPVGIRLGKRFGIVDKPDPRKVHTGLIPRTGGLAIAISVIVSLSMTMALPRETLGYLCGAVIILVFGLWDDLRDLSYRVKFAGQIAAALVFALISGSYVCCLGEIVPGVMFHLGPAAILVTVFFLVAVINIINLSDGLDGLAGGLALLILLACALLGYLQDSGLPIIIALAVIGGLIGFMRFNIHPAEVFMGDTGSQFLGYSIGVCLILLTQDNSIYSPVLPLFLLGTPILDTAMVMHERIRSGKSPFKPDKNHLHHKFLRVGFRQDQAVLIIYILHFSIIIMGLMMRYVSDYYVLLAYICVIAFGFLLNDISKQDNTAFFSFSFSIKKRLNRFFSLKERVFDLRFILSCIFWKSFFVLYAFFFVISLVYIEHVQFYSVFFSGFLLFILFFIYVFQRHLVVDYAYYAMVLCIVYVSVFGELSNADYVFSVISPDAVHFLFYVLSILYFGCMVLSPERVPLNSLDYILLALICFLFLIPDSDIAAYNLKNILMKSILLSLGLNLIYSRIQRNKEYVILLLVVVLVETSIVSLVN